MKRIMPSEHLKRTNRYFAAPSIRTRENQHASHQARLSRQPRPLKKRKHNDSISESKLIKEKLPSSSLATIGKSINLLIPRNNPNVLESIDLTATDDAVIKQLMTNNSCELSLEENDNDYEPGDGSDSETVTGDESFYDDSDSEEYTIDNDRA